MDISQSVMRGQCNAGPTVTSQHCGKRESCHWLVRCQDLRQRRSSENKTTEGVNLYMQGGQLYEQRCGSL